MEHQTKSAEAEVMERSRFACCSARSTEPWWPLWLILALGAWGVGGFAVHMFIPSTWRTMSNPTQAPVYEAHAPGLYMHIIGGIAMLMLGPVQFLKTLRRSSAKSHRVIGYIYYTMLYPASAGAFWLAFYAFSGLPALLGFACLAAGWVATGYLAFVAIKEKRIQDHKEWMLRNYALTYAAVTLRIMLSINMAVNGGRATEAGYAAISWMCWVANLIIMEFWIRFVERNSTPASSWAVGSQLKPVP